MKCVAMCCSARHMCFRAARYFYTRQVCCSVLQRGEVCCSGLQCTAQVFSRCEAFIHKASVLQCVAAWWSVWQWVAVCCSVLQCVAVCCTQYVLIIDISDMTYAYVWQFSFICAATTHCNTLQHTATHCNTLQHTATHCNTILIHMCRTHSYVWHYSFMCVTLLIRMCDITHSHMWHDSCIYMYIGARRIPEEFSRHVEIYNVYLTGFVLTFV